ncbi:MAG: clostripain-related cysteine peptidase, partial [Thermoplasmatota archaeon]
MKRQHLVIASIVAVAVLVVAGISLLSSRKGKGPGEPEGPTEAEWTTFMWLDGEGDLGEWNMMLCNVHYLEMVPDNELVNVVIIIDKELEGDTRLLELKQGGSIEMNLTDINPEWSSKELNMGDGDQLLEFLKWGVENYPARKYNVHLSDHGGG